MARKKKPETISDITDMVEFLKAHMELEAKVNGLKEEIEKGSKLKLNDLSAIDDYLSEKKKLRTTREKIDYLNNMDPASFDEELVRLGVETMSDVDNVIDAFRKMDDIGNSFAATLRESGVLDRLTTSLPAAISALGLNPMPPNVLSVPRIEFGEWTTQLQTLQLPIQQLKLISQSFVSSPSLVLANQLVQQMAALTAPLTKIYLDVAPVIPQLNELSRSLEQASVISSVLSAELAPISQLAQQMSISTAPIISQLAPQINAMNDSLAKIQQQMAPLRSLAMGYDKLYGSKHSGVYHRSFCPYTQKIEPANLILFSSAKEANEAGYSPCKLCQPP